MSMRIHIEAFLGEEKNILKPPKKKEKKTE
jgi:hypothetical protein